MVGEDDLEAARQDLHKVQATLQQILGVPSRWNGIVELLDRAEPLYGKKQPSCAIALRTDVLLDHGALRWREMIHESLHALSAGYSLTAWRESRAWEEGTVEQLQRLLRGRILSTLGIDLDEAGEAETRRLDAESKYNPYVDKLEQYRRTLEMTAEEFYPWVLRMPLAERAPTVTRLYLRRVRKGSR